jgi:small subunit ribosomal protein S23e
LNYVYKLLARKNLKINLRFFILREMGVGKPRGVRAGRKLRDHRREQRWADKTYNKAMIGSRYRNPFMGASHAKGLVVEKIGV